MTPHVVNMYHKMETKYTEIIGKYLNGELKREELDVFEEKLKTDTLLQQELKLEQDLDKIILDEDVLGFRKELVDIRQEMKNDKGQSEGKGNEETIEIKLGDRSQSSGKWYLLAASIAIMVGLAGYFYFMQNQTYSNERLFAQYYSVYPSDIAERSDEISPSDSFVLGLMEYEEGDFYDASRFLSLAVENDDQNFSAHLYLGVSFLEMDSLSRAIKGFNIIINDRNNLFVDQAKWYLALTYIKADDEKNQKEIHDLLGSIIQENGDRAKEAKEILEKIKQD